MTKQSGKVEAGAVNERVYKTLRQQIMQGDMPPGEVLTLRGIGARFGVSMTPARESVRRLVAEGALTMSSTGRVSAPELKNERIEELAAIRALLEPELACRALPRAYSALIDRLQMINGTVDAMIATKDASGYIRANLEFHRTLYLRAQAPAMLAMAETVWLQLGPTMRRLYAQMHRAGQIGQHPMILAALRASDESALRRAVENDVTRGLRMITL